MNGTPSREKLSEKATTINIPPEDRLPKSIEKSQMTPEQTAFIEKLRDITTLKAKTSKDKKLKAAADLSAALVDLLPENVALAVCMCEIYKAHPDTIKQVRELFNFHLDV